MAALTKANGQSERLTFGAKEWAAFMAIALAPACGFATWGYSIGQSLAANEQHDVDQDRRLDRVVVSLDSAVSELHLIVRHDQRLQDLERRISGLEERP